MANWPAMRPSFTTGEPAAKVSYYSQIRPIFQANCNGCHQPAKAKGEYIMTAFDKLLKGGESGDAAIVPGQPDKSYLVQLITPKGEVVPINGAQPYEEVKAVIDAALNKPAVTDAAPSQIAAAISPAAIRSEMLGTMIRDAK